MRTEGRQCQKKEYEAAQTATRSSIARLTEPYAVTLVAITVLLIHHKTTTQLHCEEKQRC